MPLPIVRRRGALHGGGEGRLLPLEIRLLNRLYCRLTVDRITSFFNAARTIRRSRKRCLAPCRYVVWRWMNCQNQYENAFARNIAARAAWDIATTSGKFLTLARFLFGTAFENGAKACRARQARLQMGNCRPGGLVRAVRFRKLTKSKTLCYRSSVAQHVGLAPSGCGRRI
jgi:hypothetical protein